MTITEDDFTAAIIVGVGKARPLLDEALERLNNQALMAIPTSMCNGMPSGRPQEFHLITDGGTLAALFSNETPPVPAPEMKLLQRLFELMQARNQWCDIDMSTLRRLFAGEDQHNHDLSTLVMELVSWGLIIESTATSPRQIVVYRFTNQFYHCLAPAS